MKLKCRNREYEISNVMSSNGLKNTIRVNHKGGYEYYIRQLTVNGQIVTLMFDNFSIKPFVISKTKTTISRLIKSDTEEILNEIYDNNIIELDYSKMNTGDMIIELKNSGFLSSRSFNQIISDYRMFFSK